MRTPDDIYDEWLVLRCQGGDAKALATLVQRWQPRLVRLAMRLLHDLTDAEDAVQTAWVVVIRRINSVNDPSALRPWLFRIVANKCADCIRRRSVRRRKEDGIPEDAIADGKQHSTDDESDAVLRLRQALRNLDEERGEILRLHYLAGASVKQIAAKLGVPIGTVKSRLHYARRKLREELEGEYDE